MIYWAPLLHFYQPPTQLHWVLKKVCNESYRPLVRLFHDLPHAKVTVNINAVLTEMLDEHGMTDVIDGLRDLAEQDRLEFTGSAKYHAILPLISEDEMLRQIVHNYQTNRRYFGHSYAPQGFFPPEMCYARNIVKPVIETGHRWMILSGIACTAPWPTTSLYEIPSEGKGLISVFRDDVLSNKISFRQTDAKGFIDQIKDLARSGEDTYVITAMDAETFGHHIQNWENLFLSDVYRTIDSSDTSAGDSSRATPAANLAARHTGAAPEGQNQKIRVVTLSKLVQLLPSAGIIEPRASSWSTSMDDIRAGNPYPLWKTPGNLVHQLQWQHLKLAIAMAKKASEVSANDSSKFYSDIARSLLDRALHSDQFWWASKRPWWDMNLVDRGLVEQREVVLNSYKAIKLSNLSEDEKTDYYYKLVASRDLQAKIVDLLIMD